MIDALVEELKIAMRHDPNMSVLEVIERATSLACPSRKYQVSFLDYPDEERTLYDLSNQDILDALTKFNKMRVMDSMHHQKAAGVG